MGTWDWDNIPHETIDAAGSPEAARLAATIVPDERLSDNWLQRVKDLTGLPQLSLVEWSISDEVEGIFGLLRDAGSSKGYVVEQHAVDTVRVIDLTDKVAERIAIDVSMDLPMAFVDDQAICALASFFSDYALISMRPDLLERWINREDLDLTLWGDEERYPRPTTIAVAKALAALREAAWDSHVEQSRSS